MCSLFKNHEINDLKQPGTTLLHSFLSSLANWQNYRAIENDRKEVYQLTSPQRDANVCLSYQCDITRLFHWISLILIECKRPSGGCTNTDDRYKSVDCDGDGIMDHVCTTTTNTNRWFVLSSEGCPNNWGTSSRTVAQCPQAFGK